MTVLIIIIVILCIIGASNDTSSSGNTYTRSDYKRDCKLSKKEMKRIRKARERAEMDAFEDMIMYMEVFSDD